MLYYLRLSSFVKVGKAVGSRGKQLFLYIPESNIPRTYGKVCASVLYLKIGVVLLS